MPPDAPAPQPSGLSSGWDRAVEAHVLQANAEVLFSDTALVAALEPLLAAANLDLDDIHVRGPPGMTVARRWTVEVQGRDKRTAARKASQLLGAMRDGSGAWRKTEVKGPDDSVGTLYLAADKNPRMIRTEMAAKKLVAEMRRVHPQTSWRLLKSEGVVCAGYQQVVKVIAESSSDVRMEYNMKAMNEHGITKEMVMACWGAVAETVSVRWSS